MVRLETTPAWELESERAPRERRVADVAVVLVVWLAGAVIFFREQWEHGWKFTMGNDGDARLIVYLNEHWFQVFHGHGSWLNPQFFYPVKGLLGWSDTFFLYQIFYSPLRLVGCDPFLAMQLTVVLLSLVGVAAFYALLRIGFGTNRVVSGIFAAAGTFSNALWLHAGSFQDTGIWLVPLVVLLGLLAWRSAGEAHTVRAGVLGFASGGLAVLLIFSTYYTSYFSILATVVVLVVCVAAFRQRFLKAVVDGLRTRLVAVVAAAVAFGIGLWPLLVTYLPAQNAEPKANYAIAISYAGDLGSRHRRLGLVSLVALVTSSGATDCGESRRGPGDQCGDRGVHPASHPVLHVVGGDLSPARRPSHASNRPRRDSDQPGGAAGRRSGGH
jgi:hypothetical protein